MSDYYTKQDREAILYNAIENPSPGLPPLWPTIVVKYEATVCAAEAWQQKVALIMLFVGGVFGVIIHAAITGTLWAR